MKQYSQERNSAQQLPEGAMSNLKSYIQDLKKVASNNKQKRGSNQNSGYFKQPTGGSNNHPMSTKNNPNSSG